MATRLRVRRAEALFQTVVGEYGGRVVDLSGDTILALFEDTCRAIAFAVDFQREFQNDAVWNDTGAPLRFRIGIHRGQVLADADRLFGIDIIIAQRLQELSPPGGACISAAARDEAPPHLQKHLRAMGTRALRNVAGWFKVYGFDSRRLSTPEIEVDERASFDGEAQVPSSGDPGVVLLPFENLSPDAASRHLCDGFTSDLIKALTRFRNLCVIARHSAFQFRNARDEDLPDVARALGVRYLTRASLQQTGPKLRINVSLIDTDTETVLWSQRLDTALREVVEIQDELSSALASRLALKIGDAERRRLARLHVPDLSTYGLVLRGEALATAMEAERVMHARRLFEQAVSIDPAYGRCYAALARTFNTEWFYGFGHAAAEALDRSLHLSLTAVERDPHDARGFAELAYAHLYLRHHDASLAAYERALDLNPNDADILADYGDTLVYCGQGERALAALHRALVLNPRPPDWYYWHLCDAYSYLRQYEQVLATARKMRNRSLTRRLRAVAHAHLGDLEAARAEARMILVDQPGFTIHEWVKRPPYRQGDEAAVRFVEGLRLAGLPA